MSNDNPSGTTSEFSDAGNANASPQSTHEPRAASIGNGPTAAPPAESGGVRMAALLSLLLASMLLAGGYGMLHDQLSYTISPEYFTRFKFHQFRIPPGLHDRRGATLVGWMATWWMGPVVAGPIWMFSADRRLTRGYFVDTLKAWLVALLVCAATGLSGLALGWLFITPGLLPDLYLPNSVEDQLSFARVGAMHDASYFGGVIGTVAACVYMTRRSKKLASRGRTAT